MTIKGSVHLGPLVLLEAEVREKESSSSSGVSERLKGEPRMASGGHKKTWSFIAVSLP